MPAGTGQPLRDGVTLMELMIMTVIIGIVAAVVAAPVNKARQSTMVASTKIELHHLMTAIELYRSFDGALPGSVDMLIESGYDPADNIAYCRFQVMDEGPPDDHHVALEAQHILTRTRVRSRYPGHAGFEELPAAGICADLAEPAAGPPGRRTRTGWNR